MIGSEMVGELTGKIIGKRIVHHHGGPMKIERTMEEKGKILGNEVTLTATFLSWERSNGGMMSKGHGIMMLKNGEKAELMGTGINVKSKGAGWSIRGARYLQTGSTVLKKLNDVVLVFDMEIEPDGTTHDKIWGWK
jgi:hypothetical protein